MFGIGFPELILIMALALIVVGPDKLPDLARSIAKTIVDLKKTAEGLKESLDAESNPLTEIKPELEEAAKKFKENVLDVDTEGWKNPTDNSALKKLDPDTRKLLDQTIVEDNAPSAPDTSTFSTYDDLPDSSNKTEKPS